MYKYLRDITRVNEYNYCHKRVVERLKFRTALERANVSNLCTFLIGTFDSRLWRNHNRSVKANLKINVYPSFRVSIYCTRVSFRCTKCTKCRQIFWDFVFFFFFPFRRISVLRNNLHEFGSDESAVHERQSSEQAKRVDEACESRHFADVQHRYQRRTSVRLAHVFVVRCVRRMLGSANGNYNDNKTITVS